MGETVYVAGCWLVHGVEDAWKKLVGELAPGGESVGTLAASTCLVLSPPRAELPPHPLPTDEDTPLQSAINHLKLDKVGPVVVQVRAPLHQLQTSPAKHLLLMLFSQVEDLELQGLFVLFFCIARIGVKRQPAGPGSAV